MLSACALTFGGLLLFEGRAADVLGRLRVLVTGVVFFTAASLMCGLARAKQHVAKARPDLFSSYHGLDLSGASEFSLHEVSRADGASAEQLVRGWRP